MASKIFKGFILAILVFTATAALGQDRKWDVVYLKDGSVIKGLILEMETNGKIKIEMIGGSILVYDMKEVERISRELPTNSDIIRPYFYKKNGVINYSSLGFLFGAPSGYSSETGFQLETAIGFKFNRWLQPSIGSGIDMYGAPEMFSPLFFRLYSDLVIDRVTPWISLDIGHAFAWVGEETYYQYAMVSGGMTYGASLGMKFNSQSSMGFQLSAGYKGTRYETLYTDWGGGSRLEKRVLNRLVIKLGFAI